MFRSRDRTIPTRSQASVGRISPWWIDFRLTIRAASIFTSACISTTNCRGIPISSETTDNVSSQPPDHVRTAVGKRWPVPTVIVPIAQKRRLGGGTHDTSTGVTFGSISSLKKLRPRDHATRLGIL